MQGKVRYYSWSKKLEKKELLMHCNKTEISQICLLFLLLLKWELFEDDLFVKTEVNFYLTAARE